jgi:hypothetical protein
LYITSGIWVPTRVTQRRDPHAEQHQREKREDNDTASW